MQGAKGTSPLWSAPLASLWAAALAGVSLFTATPLHAATPVKFAGEIGGMVTDAAGHPQCGAVVMLFNRQERMLQRSSTDLGGAFSFDDLLPDLYSIRVSLSSFVPALKDRVAVRAGMRSLLEVNLSRVFSTVQLVSTAPATGGLMNDDWKWTLRSNSSLRPILRFMPVVTTPDPKAPVDAEKLAVFSGSRGLVRISASDGAQTIASNGEADLGTQFAFATSVYGGNHLQFSGNVGYGAVSGSPAAAIRTTYSRDFGAETPAISVTMRQMFVPLHAAQNLVGSPGNEGGSPAMRTLAVSFGDKTQVTDSLTAEYGFELDMVSFLDRMHYFSPYSKLTYALPRGKVDLTWTSGNARPELGLTPSDQNADLQRDLTALSVLPRVTLDSGRVKIQRGDDYEIGISERFGSREYRVAAYSENISNMSLTVANPTSGLFYGDLMPDLFSNSASFNAGHFNSVGYLMSVTQDLGENYKITATYGSTGVMAPRLGGPPIETADDLRRALEPGDRGAVTLKAIGTVKPTGTRFMASYQWTDYKSGMPAPLFSTQSSRPEPGLNVMLRQPIPSIPGLPWRIEASAELRNLLAQGYLPVSTADGHQLLLVNTPRSIRGGLAFVF